MPEDPKTVLKAAAEKERYKAARKTLPERRTKTQRQRHAQIVLENLHEQRVFYYPGAEADWEPLRRLTHVCDTFIFSDWNVTAARVEGDFDLAGVKTDFIIPLGKEDVAYLADLHQLPYGVRQCVQDLGGPHLQPWGKYAQLTRTVGNVNRKLHFFYLGMDGITAYFNLFAPHGMAPRVLCLKFGMDPNGQRFGTWADGGLGKTIRGVEALPEQMVGMGGPDCDWPYPIPWQRFPGWPGSPDAHALALTKIQPPALT